MNNQIVIAGRHATVSSARIQRRGRNHGSYTLMMVTFHDTGEVISMTAAAYAKWADKLERAAKAA